MKMRKDDASLYFIRMICSNDERALAEHISVFLFICVWLIMPGEWANVRTQFRCQGQWWRKNDRKKHDKRNIDKAIQRESVQLTLHCKSTRNKSDCRNMSHNVTGTAGHYKTPEFTQTLSETDENDQMRHGLIQQQLYNSYSNSPSKCADV